MEDSSPAASPAPSRLPAPHPSQGGKSPAALAALAKRKRSTEESSESEDNSESVPPPKQRQRSEAPANDDDRDSIDQELLETVGDMGDDSVRGMNHSLSEVPLPADVPTPSQLSSAWFQAPDGEREGVVSAYKDAFKGGAAAYLQAAQYQMCRLFEGVAQNFGDDKAKWDFYLESLTGFVHNELEEMAEEAKREKEDSEGEGEGEKETENDE
ncbi:hypothetical protein C8Q77DRAFT_1076458 [Trametes polyzona]|nr:hypothetical protein C8Q77DRAFT_1076458 [Trametes polyzona]